MEEVEREALLRAESLSKPLHTLPAPFQQATSPPSYEPARACSWPDSRKQPRTSPDYNNAQPSRFPKAFPGLFHNPRKPNPDPEQKNRQETNPNQPNTNRRQEKRRLHGTLVTREAHSLNCPSERPRNCSERVRQAGPTKFPEKGLEGRTRSRLEAVNHTRENLKPEFGSYMEDE